MFRSRTTHSALTRDPKHIHLQYAWYRIRSAFVRRIKLMYSRLEDRIRILCDKVLANPNSPEMLGILNELRAAPHEHTDRLRQRLQFPIPPDRRSA
jgi:hypothetical protein